jgi:hypothetical protein
LKSGNEEQAVGNGSKEKWGGSSEVGKDKTQKMKIEVFVLL